MWPPPLQLWLLGVVAAGPALLRLSGDQGDFSISAGSLGKRQPSSHTPPPPPALTSLRRPQETQELQKQQQWYQENQVTLTAEDKAWYLSYYSQAVFRMRILEQRLNR